MKRFAILFLLGIGTLVIALIIDRWAGNRVSTFRLHAMDWATVRIDGLRLGRRPASAEIVLVLVDSRTAAAIGYVSSVTHDAKLYRQLVDAGASVIYDSRPVIAADAETFAQYQPLLDSMLEIDSQGRIMRDIVLSSAILDDTENKYDPLMASNVLKPDPHLFPFLRSRLYPMFQFSTGGISESAPLRIGQIALGQQPLGLIQIAEQMSESGVSAAWHRQAPEAIPPNDNPPSPYPLGNFDIPWFTFTSTSILVPPAAFWVSYDIAVEDYRRFSMLDLLESASEADFKDKIVIIGRSCETEMLDDPYEIPSKIGKASAAEVIAAAVQTILDRRFMHELPRWIYWGCIALFCIVFVNITGWLRPILAIAVSICLMLCYLALAAIVYRNGWFADFAMAPLFGAVGGLLGLVYSAWATLQSRRRIVELFGRYVPRAVVSQLMLRPDLKELTLGGERRTVSVLFADIRGFTSFSEDLDPEEVVQQLNSLLEIMVDCTFENEGTLDKFIGDAILVLFNAPINQIDHLQRAVRTATEMQKRLTGHATGLQVGIGVHCGEAVVGNVGTQQRLEYTAIGNTVNIASRLCSMAQPGEVIVSSAVIEAMPEKTDIEPLGPLQIKGIKKTVDAYRIVNQQA